MEQETGGIAGRACVYPRLCVQRTEGAKFERHGGNPPGWRARNTGNGVGPRGRLPDPIPHGIGGRRCASEGIRSMGT